MPERALQVVFLVKTNCFTSTFEWYGISRVCCPVTHPQADFTTESLKITPAFSRQYGVDFEEVDIGYAIHRRANSVSKPSLNI